DVDAELERIGRRHAEQLALDEAALDRTPLRGRVPGTVRREPFARLLVDSLAREPVDQLRALPALREADRAKPARDERGHDSRRIAARARAEAELCVEQLWVPQDDSSFRARRRVLVDHGRVDARQVPHELAGVRDRCSREDDLRLCAVDTGEATEPADDVAD